MDNVFSSRKLWGAMIGAILILAAVNLTPEENVSQVVYIIGALFGTAIGGQAYGDIMGLFYTSKRSNVKDT